MFLNWGLRLWKYCKIWIENSRVFQSTLYDLYDGLWRFRKSRSQIFYITVVSKHFSKIHRKRHCRSLVLKVALSQIFSNKYVAFFRKAIFKNTSKQMLLEKKHEYHIPYWWKKNGVNLSQAKLLVGEKSYSPLKNWSFSLNKFYVSIFCCSEVNVKRIGNTIFKLKKGIPVAN